MTTQHLYFLRHAQGIHNARLPHGPMADIPLTEEGFQTLATIADKIAAADFMQTPDVIRVSPLLRTIQTAEGLKPLYPAVPFELDPYLIEWAHFDVPAGMIMSAEDKVPLIDEFWRRLDPNWVANDLGESFSDCVNRVRHVQQTLFNDPQDSIVCVSHGYFMQTFVMHLIEKMHATAESMELLRSFDRLRNLDIIHIERERITGQITIAHHKFEEDYRHAHAYPVQKALSAEDDVVLI